MKSHYWYRVVKVNNTERNEFKEGSIHGSTEPLPKQNFIYSEKKKDFIVDFEREFLFRNNVGESKESVIEKLRWFKKEAKKG